MTTMKRERSEPRRYPLAGSLAPSFLCIAGFMPFLVQPAIVEGLTAIRHLSVDHAGMIVGGEMIGIMLGSLWAPLLMRSHRPRPLAMRALLVMAAADFTTIYANATSLLLTVRIGAGLGEGVAIALAYALLSNQRHPGRGLGINAALLTLFGGLAGLCLPTGFAHIGFSAVPALLIASVGIAIAITPLLPNNAEPREAPVAVLTGTPSRQGAFAMLACTIMFLGQGTSWAYLFVLGTQASLDPNSVAVILTIGLAASSLGGLLLAAIPSIQGTTGAAFVGATTAALSLLPIWHQPDLSRFALTCMAYTLATGFLTPFSMLVIAQADRTGKLTQYGGAAQLLGLALGPIAGGWLLASGDSHALLLLSMILMGGYWLIALPATVARSRAPERSAPMAD